MIAFPVASRDLGTQTTHLNQLTAVKTFILNIRVSNNRSGSSERCSIKGKPRLPIVQHRFTCVPQEIQSRVFEFFEISLRGLKGLTWHPSAARPVALAAAQWALAAQVSTRQPILLSLSFFTPQSIPPMLATLTDASGAGLDHLLSRAKRRRGGQGAVADAADAAATLQAAAAGTGVQYLPPPRRRAAPGACGAAAAVAIDAPERGDEEPEPQPPQQQEGGQGGDTSPAEQQTEHVEEDEEWDDADGDDDDEVWEEVTDDDARTHISSANDAGAGGAEPLTITLSLGRDGGAPRRGQRGGGGGGQQRRAFSKADREAAAAVHRAHLLCLLARGLLYDAAADDGLLQAVLLSLLPPDVAAASAAGTASSGGGGAAAAGTGCRLSTLLPLLRWFHATFRMLTPGGGVRAGPTPGSAPQQADEVAEAVLAARGLPAVVEQLLEVRRWARAG